MGHAQRNANRAAGIAENKSKLKGLGKAMDGLLKEWGTHVKEHEVKSKLRAERNEAIDNKIEDLEERFGDLEFWYERSRLPFWKRWYLAIQDRRSRIKDQ